MIPRVELPKVELAGAEKAGVELARVELECAMAAIITSPSAKAHFEADANDFAGTFGLAGAARERLRRMGPDLVALTGGFVAKRATTMRWNARRTLALLGAASATGIVNEFIDLHPATDSFRDEARHFGDFVVQRTAAARDGSVRADVIAEMARFERSRSASFWGAVAEIDRPDRSRPSRLQLRLRPGATTHDFSFDLRLLFHDTKLAADQCLPDACTLCFVHIGTASGFRVMRLQEAEAELVRSFIESDASVVDDSASEADAAGLVDRLVRGGVLEWV